MYALRRQKARMKNRDNIYREVFVWLWDCPSHHYSVFEKCWQILLRVLVCTVHPENAKERQAISENALKGESP